jgi:hypothetical protein
MRTEIYIENQQLDLYKDISAEFTYNIDDVKDFSSRNTNFSKTIVIPGNATNNKLFGHIFEFGSGNFYNPSSDNVGYNFNASKSAACVVYVDKIQIFKGIIRLLEIIIDNGSIEYECAVFGELGGFVSALGNKKLEELDFSAYNHQWSKTNIVNSWDQASGSTASGMGYFYPLIDYGQVDHNSKLDFEIGAFRPALFVREYMKKIIEGAGYTFTSSFFDTNLFKRLVIPNNQKKFSQLKQFNLDINTTGYSFTEADGTSKLVSFAIQNIVQDYTINGANTIFTYTGASFSGTISLNVTGTWFKNSSTPFVLQILKNGSAVTNITWESSSSLTTQVFNINTSYAISLATNDTLSLQFTQTTASDFGISIGAGSFSTKVQPPQPVSVDFNLNDVININASSIPRGIFQKDFFSSIVKMFNLYVTESTDKTKHLNIEPYIDYYDFDNTIDWTLKVDRSKPFRLKPMSELNGRYFEYKYKSDSDFYNENYQKKYAEGYADLIEDTGFEFANDKQTAEIIFASSPLVGYSGRDKIMTAIYKKSNTQNNDSEDTMDSVIRIMQVKKITGVTNWHIKDTGGGNIGGHLHDYGYGGHLDNPDAPTADINFGAPKEIYFTLATPYPSANLFNGYWSDYVAEISDKDSKLLTCNVRLTDIDIYNLDFSRPIWIDGSLWRLNKVMDYNPMVEDTTKCEFIKVIETTYA